MKKRSTSAPAGSRIKRIADQIQRDLGELIPLEVRDPRVVLVTVTGVEVTADYAHAKVFVSSLRDDPEEKAGAVAALNEASGWLHSLLYKRLHIHTVPRLHFLLDETGVRGLDLTRLIDTANASRARDD
ncbi:30S ribosome-binding factor RbfA [Derxia lacustris]|uniref:30S ribosome-binding factor RbfA n=1 Tax=Derxia lacustris TaxID=764842 RepID=UPI000A177541|nr:30S ribosome-binding factor RbfA [Derxia lacustris]